MPTQEEVLKVLSTCEDPELRKDIVTLGMVKNLAVDCDMDCLLVEIEQPGAACHEGYKSCFFRSIENGEVKVTEPQLVDPEKVYGKK